MVFPDKQEQACWLRETAAYQGKPYDTAMKTAKT